ncbi:MAG: hypothetical protein PWP23_1740 [Candidatus Sumerlaeota bacterium]|nr:hypothetical protein [Candidatus Sumerlaeota bacterium]
MDTQMKRTLLLAAALSGAAIASAVSVPPNVVSLTTTPEDDFAPSPSRSGDAVAFVSLREGEPDIYWLDLQARQAMLPAAVAPSPARDSEPALSPDGKWLAWVSTREDAFGDIWVTRFPDGTPFALTQRGDRDSQPHWIGEGSDAVVRFRSERADGSIVWREASPSKWSNVRDLEGMETYSPPRALAAVALDDTNGDGVIDAARGDHASICVLDPDGRPIRQISPPIPRLDNPVAVPGMLVFAAEYRRGLDVYRTTAPFLVATLDSPSRALSAAEDAWASLPGRPFDAIALARQGVWLAEVGGDHASGTACLLLGVRILRENERPEQALVFLDDSRKRLGEGSVPEAALLDAWRSVLRIDAAQRAGAAESALAVRRHQTAEQLAAVFAQQSLDVKERAWAGLEHARQLGTLARYEDAVQAAAAVKDIEGLAPDDRALATLEQARLYARFLPEDARRLLLETLRQEQASPAMQEKLALELTDLVTRDKATLDEKVIALRQFESTVQDLEIFKAAARYREGSLFAGAGRWEEAKTALGDAATFTEAAPRLSAQASFDLAEILARQARYAEAIDTYESVSEEMRSRVFPEAPRFYQEAREGLLRRSIEKGDAELRLGDPQLALATFRELLDRDPRAVEGWRGRLEAEYRSKVLFPENFKRYEEDAEKKKDDPLAQYVYGLALTYTDKFPYKSVEVLERAAALDNSVPYFHQTLGFAFEHFARTKDNRQFAANALEEYQRALVLLDAAARPADYARLLVNTGNAALALGQNGRAAEFYTRRLEQGVAFDDPRTEFLMHRSHGIALFRSSQPSRAVASFDNALRMLDELAERGMMNEEETTERRTELMDRKALSLFDGGRLAEAAELFLKVAARQEPNSLNRARALRNAGFALLRQANPAEGTERTRLRNEARRHLEEALTLLESPNLVMPGKTESKRALLDLQFGLSAGGADGARRELTREDEVYLVRAALSRLRVDARDPAAAVAALKAQLTSQSELESASLPYYRTARVITLDQLAGFHRALGEDEEAADALLEALELTRFVEKKVEFINGAGLAQTLTHLAEIHLEHGPGAIDARRLRSSWIGEGLPDGSEREVLTSAIRAALRRRDAAKGEYVLPLERPAWRSRLLLASALLAERSASEAPSDGIGEIRAAGDLARACELAESVIASANGEFADAETKRLGVLAHGLLVRIAWRMQTEAHWSAARRRALVFTEMAGHPELAWWIEAQAATAPDEAFAREAAERALARIEDAPPGLAAPGAPVPVALLAHCERVMLRQALAAEDWAAALETAERWRVARLRLALDDITPPVRTDFDEDVRWRDEALRLRAEYREAVAVQRGTPFTANIDRAAERAEQKRIAWLAHIEQGRADLLPSALLLLPLATPVEDPVAALDDLLALPEPPAFILSTAEGSVAWTTNGALRLESPDDWRAIKEAAKTWFVLGDPLDSAIVAERVVNMLTFETTFHAMREFRLALPTGEVSWPPADTEAGELPALPQVSEPNLAWRLDKAVRAPGFDPDTWTIGETQLPLTEFLAALPPPDSGALELEPLVETEAGSTRLKQQLAGSLLAHSGAGTAEISGDRWLGFLFAPTEAPQIAGEELNANAGMAAAYLRENEQRAALAPLSRVHLLRKALERPTPEIAESGMLLAQVQGDLGNFSAAAATMKDIVERQRAEGDAAPLAQALRLYASYALSDYEFEAAQAAYEEAERLYAGLQQTDDEIEMAIRAGVALENSGRYNDALQRYEEVLARAQDLGKSRLVAEQWRRIGRIYLHRLNDYPFAEDAFTQALDAAERAGAEDLVIQLTLDLARVDERLGRYEPAIALTRLMEEKARSANVPLLAVDALMLRAFTEWVRAGYFDAYKALREGMALAEQIDARDQLIIGHNTGGLLAWTLNDTEGALREFTAALELARAERLPTEESSTLNNRALVYRSLGRYNEALADLGAALALDTKHKSVWGQAYVLRNTGITYQQMGQPEAALDPLLRAVDLSEQTGDRTNRTKALLALGDAQRETGQTQAALASYEEALAEARALPVPEVEWRALYAMALLADERGDAAKRRASLAEAIEVVENLRARIRIEEFQDGFLLDKQSLYDEMIALLLDQGETRSALDYSERSRARNFIDLLGNAKVQLAVPQDQQMIDRENKLREEIEILEKRIGSSSAADKQALQEQLDNARRRYSDFLIELRAFNPQLSSFVEVSTMESTELQTLLEPDTALLVYHVLPDSVVVWVIRRDSLDVVRTPVVREELVARIGGYRQRLQNFDRIEEESAILSALLWEPVRGLLPGVQRIGVAPHRELHLFPFASLRSGDRNLIDDYALFYTPSASVLAYTIGRRGQRQANNRVLAIGNPDLGNEALDLPFAQKEAERIPWTFPDADVLTGDRATESWLAQNISEYGIVHLATHGEYDANLPLLSAIQLTPDEQNDGRLTAREVFSLSLKADLVALSACQTGLGRLSNGDDVVGLNRSFVYAGTRQIMSSLWRVDDVSTAVLVKHFYRNIEETDRADALRRAQIEVRRRYPHPAHWAGLFLSGDWQ